MIIWGINETSHDAALSVIQDGDILFAGHAERYSKQKNDWFINDGLIEDALQYGKPDQIAYYEKQWLKKQRILLAGGLGGGKPYFKQTFLKDVPLKSFSHHYSHAAAGYFTSNFNNAVVVVLDAIGEWNTSTVWSAKENNLNLIHKQNYPFSFGLFYSAFTQLIGLMPNQEEYIMMGMAAYGNEDKYYKKVSSYFPSIKKQKYGYHKGIIDWSEKIEEQDKFDIAAAVQKVYTERLIDFMNMAKKISGEENLVFMGGCALNCSSNTELWKIFKNVWIMPNPGDAGSSLGAAAALYGKHLNWKNAYLGYDLGGEYPTDKIVDAILKNKIVAVATGKAEFGPRALGNRSILADPRDPNVKDEVNKIKKRELFRPFAPMIMEEHASQWFDMDFTSPYMQYAVKCLKPSVVPSVVHADGTSRVQTVSRKDNLDLWGVLNAFYNKTGVPILLNTSLNITGQPLLNDEQDIIEWERTYNFEIIR